MSTQGDPDLDLAVAKAMGKNMVQPVNVETGRAVVAWKEQGDD